MASFWGPPKKLAKYRFKLLYRRVQWCLGETMMGFIALHCSLVRPYFLGVMKPSLSLNNPLRRTATSCRKGVPLKQKKETLWILWWFCGHGFLKNDARWVVNSGIISLLGPTTRPSTRSLKWNSDGYFRAFMRNSTTSIHLVVPSVTGMVAVSTPLKRLKVSSFGLTSTCKMWGLQTNGVAQTQTRFKVFLWNNIPCGNSAMSFHFTATMGDVVTVISPPRGRPYFHATWSCEDPVSPKVPQQRVPSLKHSWGFILSVPSVQGIFSQMVV